MSFFIVQQLPSPQLIRTVCKLSVGSKFASQNQRFLIIVAAVVAKR